MRARFKLYLCGILFLLCCCDEYKKDSICLQDIEVEQLSFKLYPTDSLLIYPRGINVWRNYLIIMEPKLKDSIYSIWDRDDFAHLFSCGRKGNGPNELINPRYDYYASTDSSFFILDSDIEREVCFEDKTLVIKRNNDITLPDAINQLVRLGDDYYILAGLTNGSTGEHIIYKNGGYSSFGEFPRKSENEERRFFTNYKLTAGDVAHDCICDFYLYQNLIRIYDIKGNLLKHIQVIDNACVPSTSVELRPVFHELKFNSNILPFCIITNIVQKKSIRTRSLSRNCNFGTGKAN